MTDQGTKYLFEILPDFDLIDEFTGRIAGFNDCVADLKTKGAFER
jgi:hypothetical protein